MAYLFWMLWVAISIHAPRRGSDSTGGVTRASYVISIHAPRRGSDPMFPDQTVGNKDFNPRSPQGERPRAGSFGFSSCRFQSTLPAGGATGCDNSCRTLWVDFNPRSPQGERLIILPVVYLRRRISIHAPRRGSDNKCSTICHETNISIHAPRRGSDAIPGFRLINENDFNPRSPQGERPNVPNTNG